MCTLTDTTPAAPPVEGRPVQVARPSSLTGTISALVPPGVFALAGWLAWGGLLDGALLGVLTWLLLRVVIVRLVLTRHHHRGGRCARAGDWAGALAAYRDSAAFWAAHPHLDRWRGPLLGSAVRWPYRVLALYNQALCLSRLHRHDEARALLDTLGRLAPGMAEARELRGWLDRPPPTGGSEADWFVGG
ncbi:MAG: tetratricopeptide repeat protein [Deltaproteobacteria bacterium]|nr:MAG: tetratricopeptide repeat protein [Deltaproteobacteria bacterium]